MYYLLTAAATAATDAQVNESFVIFIKVAKLLTNVMGDPE